MANSEDPEQSDLGLHWLPDLSVRKLRAIMVIHVCTSSLSVQNFKPPPRFTCCTGWFAEILKTLCFESVLFTPLLESLC